MPKSYTNTTRWESSLANVALPPFVTSPGWSKSTDRLAGVLVAFAACLCKIGAGTKHATCGSGHLQVEAMLSWQRSRNQEILRLGSPFMGRGPSWTPWQAPIKCCNVTPRCLWIPWKIPDVKSIRFLQICFDSYFTMNLAEFSYFTSPEIWSKYGDDSPNPIYCVKYGT